MLKLFLKVYMYIIIGLIVAPIVLYNILPKHVQIGIKSVFTVEHDAPYNYSVSLDKKQK